VFTKNRKKYIYEAVVRPPTKSKMGVAETTPVWPGSSSTFSFFFLFSLFDLVGRPNHFHEPQGWFSHPKRPNPLLLFFFFFFFLFFGLMGWPNHSHVPRGQFGHPQTGYGGGSATPSYIFFKIYF
jgi:hypothetical protein